MNRKNLSLAVIFCVFLFGMVSQTFGQANPNVPSWFMDLPPADVLWGIGIAKLPDNRHAMNLAEIRAREDLARQICFSLDLYFGLYNRIGLGAQLFVYTCVNNNFSFEIINDTRVLRQWQAPDGTVWCLVEMRKANINKYRSIYERIFNEHYQEYLVEIGQ